MISVSLRDFAATGMFGPIQLGMTRTEIEQLLGTPELWGTEKHCGVATIWRYSEIEFYFEKNKLFMVFTDHDTLANGGNACAIDPWIIRPGLPGDELETALRGERIEFTVSRPNHDLRQRLILTAGSVEFSFVDHTDPEWPHERIGLFSWNKRIGP